LDEHFSTVELSFPLSLRPSLRPSLPLHLGFEWYGYNTLGALGPQRDKGDFTFGVGEEEHLRKGGREGREGREEGRQGEWVVNI